MKVYRYRDHDVELRQGGLLSAPSFRFYVRLEGSRQDSASDTWEGITRTIDAFHTRKIKSRKLALPVIDSTETAWTITGINLHTEVVTGAPSDDQHGRFGSHYDVYPDVEWIRGALAQRADLEREVSKITELLKPYSIATNRRPGWDGKIPRDYGERCDQLEAEYNEKREKAEIEEEGR